ncbi:MAG: T9SS type A sorting domain-containing protein [Bacteroidetes bacterium]|nr:T9SS type A sorting domain-containing protein [Bacteroidota bacterium]MBP6402733.1 T9SS type A sorting domain-containing protein [Bacteroidia bacterium]MBP6650361.1 T9SS type A sorting domain-containing protein [Bacteroidia bacterium]
MNKLLLFSFFMLAGTLSAQIISRRTYPINTIPPAFTISEVQFGTAVEPLKDGGVAVGGQIVYTTMSVMPSHNSERQFILKTDLSLNEEWQFSYELFADDYPFHFLNFITPLSDSGFVFSTDTSDVWQHTAIRKKFANGSTDWFRCLPANTVNDFTTLTRSVQRNDTILFSGTTLSSNNPFLIGTNGNGDTLFFKDYSGYASASVSYLKEDSQGNLYLVLEKSPASTILRIDTEGNVLSVYTLALPYTSSNYNFYICLSPSRILVVDDVYYQYFKLLDSNGNLLDSVNIGCTFLEVKAGINGEFLAQGRFTDTVSFLPIGKYLMNFDSLGQFSWAIRYNLIDTNDFIRTFSLLNDSVILATGMNGYLAIPAVLLFKLKAPYFDKTILSSSSVLSSCTNDSILLQAAQGYNYKWISGETTQSIYVHQGGDYKVLLSDTAGNFAYSNTVHISENPPSVNLGADTLLCTGQMMILDAGTNFSSYLWQDGSTTSQDTITGIVTEDTLLVSVQVSDSFGCIANDTVQLIYQICIGLDERYLTNSFVMFPNPASDELHISTPGKIIQELSLFNILGECISSIHPGKESHTLLCKHLRSGIYFLKVQTQTGWSIKRFIKE